MLDADQINAPQFERPTAARPQWPTQPTVHLDNPTSIALLPLSLNLAYFQAQAVAQGPVRLIR